MSTKIYSGLKATVPAAELFRLHRRVMAVVQQESREMARAEVRQALESLLTTWSLHPSKRPPNLQASVRAALLEKLEDRSPTTHLLEDPLRFAISYNALKDGTLLALPFGPPAYQEALLQAGLFEAYGYWDNTDPEEGVSEEAWEARRLAWEEFLGDANPLGVADQAALTWSLGVSYQTIPQAWLREVQEASEEEALLLAPPSPQQERKHATAFLTEALMAQALSPQEGSSLPTRDLLKVLHQAREEAVSLLPEVPCTFPPLPPLDTPIGEVPLLEVPTTEAFQEAVKRLQEACSREA